MEASHFMYFLKNIKVVESQNESHIVKRSFFSLLWFRLPSACSHWPDAADNKFYSKLIFSNVMNLFKKKKNSYGALNKITLSLSTCRSLFPSLCYYFRISYSSAVRTSNTRWGESNEALHCMTCHSRGYDEILITALQVCNCWHFFCRYGFIEGHVVIPRIHPNAICAANHTGVYVLTSNTSQYDTYCFNASGWFQVASLHFGLLLAGKPVAAWLTAVQSWLKWGFV